MAELVGVAGVTHNPLMWGKVRAGAAGLAAVESNFESLRRWLSDLKPDVMVVVASDHFHMLFTWNMPAFMVGKAETIRATFPNETRSFGLESATLPGSRALADEILGHPDLVPALDFAFTDQPWLDHAFLVPLLFLTPELDVPVIPVFTNTTAPPLPTARRFADLGLHLRSTIERSESAQRVVIVGSGHLAHELGGPRQFLGSSPDPDFDGEAVAWMRSGDLDSMVRGSTSRRLGDAGNETYQFLNFITCLAAAGGPANIAEATPTSLGNLPFFAWYDP